MTLPDIGTKPDIARSDLEFWLYRDVAKEWRWRLLSSNGNIVAESGEGYKRKIDCKAAIAIVQRADDETPVLEIGKL